MMSAAARETLYLIDAHALIFQVFHAIPAMTSPSGLPTNALFGFTRDLLFLRTQKRPDFLVCAIDLPGPTFRDQLYPAYKANRQPPHPDLQAQLPLIYDLLEALRVPVVGKPGFEADDILATLARAGAARGLQVFICTNDKDCRQLIDDHVQLYNLRKHAVFDRAALLADWGITPEQVVDFQVLVGDPVDNIPGVPGIGPKTAARLLQQFGNLDNLLAHLDQVSGARQRQALQAAAPDLQRSRTLVRLVTDVPLDMDWEGWRLRPWDTPRLLHLFRAWGFRSFADQVQAASSDLSPALNPPQEPEPASVQGELFPFGANAPEGNGQPTAAAVARGAYHLINTPKQFKAFLAQLRRQKRFAVDLETTGLNPLRSEPVGYAFSWKPGEAYYVAVRGPETEAVLDPQATLRQLAPILEDPQVAKVNQNIKFDLLVLRKQGVTLAGVAGDPMLADYLLHAGERSHSLADLASRYFNHRVIPISDLIGTGKTQLRMDQVPTAQVAEYAGEDADLACRLCERLEAEVRAAGLGRLYDELEVPLIDVLAELEYNGIRLDVPLLNRLSDEMGRQLADIERQIHELAGRPFNIASPKQLRQVLFDELKLPAQRRTGVTGEPSTNQETLERLAVLGHPLPRLIVEHRQVAKLKGTYVDALPALVNPDTGRVHASFNQTVAATGRLSSSDPNLQNIPVRTEQGRQIRQAFLPEPGWLLLTADYSQIELRLLAHFTQDEALLQTFAEDRDIHTAVAAQIHGVAEDAVTPAMRRAAKTVNFGVIYGISAHGLAQRLGIVRDEAARFIDAYFARYPKVLEHQQRLLENCRRVRYVSTILGRRREITGIRSDSTYQQRNQPEREAINMEIQGSAADLIKLAMLHLYRRLKRERRQSRMLLQIHDELVFEVPPDELDDLACLVDEEMTQTVEQELHLRVPLKVDLAAGPNWLDVAPHGVRTVA